MSQNLDELIDKKTDETLDATRRIRALAEETQQIGIETAGNLQAQGDQLREIQGKQAEVEEGLAKTHKNLNILDRCCCFLIFNKKAKPNDDTTSSAKRAQKDLEQKEKAAERTAADASGGGSTTVPPLALKGNIQRITNDAREDEMDENIGHVSHIVGNLKNLALDMNKELVEQNEILDELTTKGEKLQEDVALAERKAQAILKK